MKEGIRLPDGTNGGKGTLLCDFAASDLNPSRLQILMALPGHRFLADYTDPLTEETQAVILFPQPESVSRAETVKLAVTGLTYQNGYRLIEDAAYVFNQSQQEYRIKLTPYGLNDSILTPETNPAMGQFEQDMIDGAEYDMMVFGLCPYDVNAVDLYDSLSEKQVFRDLSGFAASCGILPSVAACYQSFGRVDSLPLMLRYTVMVKTGTVQNENIDLARLTEETQSLADGALFLPFSYQLRLVREAGLSAFYRKAEKNCSFDSPEFLRLYGQPVGKKHEGNR